MFDVKTLEATPSLARRLVRFSEIKGLQFGEDLVDLAMQDLISVSDLESFPLDLPEEAIPALQHIRDWNGRAMLLCSSTDAGRKVALADLWIKPASKILIMAQTKSYGEWAHLLREIRPDAKISVFGNPRYHNASTVYPDGVKFSEQVDFTADIFITNYSGLLWNDFFSHMTVDRTIVEEMEAPGALPYKWTHQVGAIFNEVPCPLFIQNINHLPTQPGRDIMASLTSPTSTAVQFLSELINSLLWPNTPVNAVYNFLGVKEAEDYLAKHHYSGVDILKLFNLIGVSTDLLDGNAANKPLVFHDTSLTTLLESKNTTSGLLRIKARERDLEQSEGLKLPELTRRALSGDRASQGLIGALKTAQWATLKSQHLKSVQGTMSNRLSRNLFLVENLDLIRSLRLQFGPAITVFDPNDADYDLMCFKNTTADVLPWAKTTYKPIQNLIVSLEDMISQPDLLKYTNYLYLPELPLDSEDYRIICDAAESSGTKIILTIIDSSIEEEIFLQLNEKS